MDRTLEDDDRSRAAAAADRAGATDRRRADAAGRPAPRRWHRFAGLLVGVALLAALASVLASRWGQLPPRALQLSPLTVGATVLLLVGVNVLFSLQWRALMRALGVRLSRLEAIRIHFMAQLGKYVPGKVFLLVSKIYLCTRQAVVIEKAALGVAYEQALILTSAALVVLLSAALSGMPALQPYKAVALLAGCCGLACLHPRVVRVLLRLLAGRLPARLTLREPSGRSTVLLLCRYGASWVANGLVFFVLARALHDLPLSYLADCVGIVTLSILAGLVAFLTPAGLGVRDGAISVLLSAYVPLPVAVAISLAHRAAWTGAELLGVVIALTLGPRCRMLAAKRAATTGLAGGPVASRCP